MKKMTIATANPVTFKVYEFFSVKIRGTNRWTSFGKKKQALGGLGNWRFKNVDVTFGSEYLQRAVCCVHQCIDAGARASMVMNMRQCEHYIAIARRNPINCFEVQDHDNICRYLLADS